MLICIWHMLILFHRPEKGCFFPFFLISSLAAANLSAVVDVAVAAERELLLLLLQMIAGVDGTHALALEQQRMTAVET